MALPYTPNHCMFLVLAFFLLPTQMAWATQFDDLKLTWGQDHSFFYMDGGDTVTLALSLDETHGSGFSSNNSYLYARFDIEIILVAGNSAGTVTTFYLLSDGPWDIHDEVDLEFLGNSTGEPYTLHTNVYAYGVGGREQQFRLWFDPTADFHTYSIIWNPKHIIILVDGVPIRDFKNHEADGVAFPSWQTMRLQGSIWNADDWATQGGRIKTDWSQAPFVALYRNLRVTPCAPSPGVEWCGAEPPESALFEQEMDAPAQQAMQSARDKYMLYDYCKDSKRFGGSGFPKECTLQ